MRNGGFTLIEVMIVISVLAGITLGLYYVNLGMTRAALHRENTTKLHDDARTSLQYMTRLLRMSRDASISFVDPNTSAVAALGIQPRTNIQFLAVADVSGNGSALDADFEIETLGPFRFTADVNDANGDGQGANQLVHLDENGDVVRVLTNYLAPGGGLTFQRTAGGIQISVQLERQGQGAAPLARVRMDQVVAIRN